MRQIHNIGVALRHLEKGLQNRNAHLVADAVEFIIRTEPQRWRTLVLTVRAIPHPKSPDVLPILKCLLEACEKLIQVSALDLSAVPELTEACIGMDITHKSLASVSGALEELEFWKLPRDAQTMKMAAFVESQHRLGKSQALSRAQDSGTLIASSLLDATIEAGNGVMVTPTNVYESHVEAMELNMRYFEYMLSAGRVPREEKDCDLCTISHPYNDPDFFRVFYTAAIWKGFEDVWEKIRYLNWTLKFESGVHICSPKDTEEFIRSEVSTIRNGEFQVEMGGQAAAFLVRSFDTARTLNALSQSIIVPPAGIPWDGLLDLVTLRAMTLQAAEEIRAHLYIDFHHYTSAVNTLRVGGSAASLNWRTWLRCLCVLRLVAKAFDIAIDKQVPNATAEDCMRSIVAVRRETLLNVFLATTDFSKEECVRALELLTFDPRRRKLELWDQPLLQLQNGLLLMAPALIDGGNPARAIENMLSQWGDESQLVRGSAFEDYLVSIFDNVPECKAARRVRFQASDGKDVEYDVVVWWQENLVLIEGKCLRAVYSAAEQWAAKKHVEEAVDQLDRRRRLVNSDWQLFRSLVPSLGLPEQPPSFERISCIAVPSVSTFTGYTRNDVFVVDERCLKRFFGEATVNARIIAPDGGTVDLGVVDRIRASDDLKVDQFRRYLRELPLAKWVRDGISTRLSPLPRVAETDPKVAIVATEYTGSKRWSHLVGDKLKDSKPLE